MLKAMKKAPTTNLWIGDKLMEVIPTWHRACAKEWQTGNASIDHILNGEEFKPLLDSPNLSSIRNSWQMQLKAAIQRPPTALDMSTGFHTQWHVCHHFLRELVANDDLMTDFAWAWLPRYRGPGLVLYRGENVDRFESGNIGSAWSDKVETAEMFASGLNNEGKGGLVLRTSAPAQAIIAGPSDHSANWLQENEFTVDWRKLGNIEQIQSFLPRER
jgi:hypothetical protein